MAWKDTSRSCLSAERLRNDVDCTWRSKIVKIALEGLQIVNLFEMERGCCCRLFPSKSMERNCTSMCLKRSRTLLLTGTMAWKKIAQCSLNNVSPKSRLIQVLVKSPFQTSFTTSIWNIYASQFMCTDYSGWTGGYMKDLLKVLTVYFQQLQYNCWIILG